MFTKDIYKPYFRPQASEAEMTKVGKISSWIIVALLVMVAIADKSTTLVRLLELKFEILIQVVPCFFLGLYWKRLSAKTDLIGMIGGLALALSLWWTGNKLVWGFHAGVIGLLLNATICAIGALVRPATIIKD